MNETIENLAGRATISAANEKLPMRTVQMEIYAEDTRDNVEHFEPYGFTSGVKPGSEGITLSFGGDRDHTVAIVIADRRYRMKVAEGEVAIYDDIGQKVHLSRSGMIFDGGGLPMKFTNTPKITFDTPIVEATKDIIATHDIKDAGGSKSMSGMRTSFDEHIHPETGSMTQKPTKTM